MSNIDEVEARLVTEVLGGDWDFTVPDPHTLEFLNPQDFEPCDLEPFADCLLGPGGLENLAREFGEGDFDVPSVGAQNVEESATDFLQCSGQDYNNVQWNDLSQDTQQPVLQNTSPGAASSDSCDTATVAGGKKRKGASGASSATQNHASTDQEQKRKIRQERNRQNAHNSRERKKMYVTQLETKCRTLESENYQLKIENASMRHQLASFYQTAGPSGVNTMGPSTSTTAGNLPFTSPVFTSGFAQSTPKLPLWPLPRENSSALTNPMAMKGDAASGSIQSSSMDDSAQATSIRKPRGKASLTSRTSSKSHSRTPKSFSSNVNPLDVSSGGIDVLAGGEVAKKPRLAAMAASVAFLCMCGVFLSIGDGNHMDVVRSGRQLHALGSSFGGYAVINEPRPIPIEPVHSERKEEPDGNILPEWASRNYSVHFPTPDTDESSALVKLKELGPLAVLLSDADVQVSNRRLLPDIKPLSNFTELITEMYTSSGFLMPGTCREVFRFDASQMKNMGEARSQLRRHLVALSMQKGFPAGAIPLPPARDQEENDESAESGWKREQGLGSEANNTGEIVSLFIPIRGDVGTSGMLTAVQSIYIVVLKPLATYWTFACPLSVPIFV